MDRCQETKYFIAIKIGKQPWFIHRREFIVEEFPSTRQIKGQYLSQTQFSLDVSRHQRKVECLFAIIRNSKHAEIVERLNKVKYESEYKKIENVVLVCRLKKERLEKSIKNCVKKMGKYYTSMYSKRLYKFEYIKRKHTTDKFMIDLHTFEDMPYDDYTFDYSLNKVKHYSVSLTRAYFSISK